uniref:Uncharacterized protein n=1 Tax=Moniliophthora roreri TaxID=221103 RepID=A0A0W0G6V3_MONRR
MQASLGLPSFSANTCFHHRHWDLDHYDATEKLHLLRRLSPATTRLARSVDLPILQDDRFEDLEDSVSTIAFDTLESYNSLEADVGDSISEADEDTDRTLYPRMER